jgi:protein pelota
MRVLHQDRRTGEIKVQIDTLDDLWHLYNIISPGDLVSAVTYRREEEKADKIRSERGEKRRMWLGLRVEKVEFHEFEDRLRVLGVIEEGPQDLGSYHTFNLQKGEAISIIKERWTDAHLKRVKRAVEESRRPQMIFVSLDQDEASVAVLRQFGLKEVAHIEAGSSGKMFEQKGEGGFYLEVAEKVAQMAEGEVPVILLGPGFAKETLLSEGKRLYPGVFNRAHLFHTGQSGMVGINELMKKGMGSGVLDDTRVAIEMRLVEEVLTGISRDGPVAYGPAQVREAVDAGAVETLLVLDSLVRTKDLDGLMRAVEEAGGRVIVVSEHHDAGRELEALGGYAALLRFKVA